jgi:FAD/FMN-containing dehydrogenase
LILVGCYSGPIERGEAVTRPLRGFATPVADLSGPVPFLEMQRLFDPDYPDGRRYYWKSVYVPDLDEAVDAALGRHAASRPSPLSSLDVWGLGGAMQREPGGGAAFAGRDHPFLVGIEANWDDAAADEANLAWARDVFRDLAGMSGGAVYLNFPGLGEEQEGLVRAAYGPNYERLAALKAKYDPTNLFRFNQNIAPAV